MRHAVLRRNGAPERVPRQLNDAYTADGYERAVACHELGHALGLDHRGSSDASCMAAQISNAATQARPDGHDYGQLETLYGHDDGYTTGSSGGGGGGCGPADLDRSDDTLIPGPSEPITVGVTGPLATLIQSAGPPSTEVVPC